MRFGISEKLKAFLRETEGFKTKAYQDTGGVWTIGYGYTKNVHYTDKITMQQAEEYLEQDLEEALKYVNIEDVCTTQGQSDALVDFVFNEGYSRLKSSTLLRYIKQGFPTEEIQGQFKRWVYGTVKEKNPKTGKMEEKKIVLKGLVKRREWEAQRWTEKD
ncbi:MAG: lysozyme [Prevotellaceae bacterium]|nr:lysozyme [Prevotellaceae bacterium]